MESINRVKEYEIEKGLADGTKTTGVITEIKDGTYDDFITNVEKFFAKSKGRGKPSDAAYQLSIKSNKTGREFEQVLGHPEKDEKLSDRSNLYKYKVQNGALPFVEQEVQLVVKDGFEKLLL